MPSLPDGRGDPPRGSGLAALLGRVFAGLAAAAMLVLGFMFSLAIFAVALVVASVVFGWLWWKMRRTLRQVRADPRFRAPQDQGNVIEGEVIRGEWRDKGD